MTLKIYDQTRLRRRKARELLQDLLYIPDIIHQVGENDHVKRLIKVERVRVRLNETQRRVLALRSFEHRTGEVHADPCARLKRRQEIALRTTNLKHARAVRDEELIDLRQPSMIRAAPTRRPVLPTR